MLPDHLSHGLDILFCGTAAGLKSAVRGHYYAGPGNRFWRLLHETGLTPDRLGPDDDHRLPSLGLGLTDLAKGVAGMDKDIPPEAYLPERLAGIIRHYRPRAVAFTSLTAARLALGDKSVATGPRHDPRWPGVTLWALSSPSGANGHFSAQSWQDLGQWHGSLT
ncbi:MAG: mismatch-specific DNA-glycosylase [bacterium]